MEIKLLSSTAKIPTRGSEYAAGFDLYADSVENINSSEGWSLQINPGETVKVNTGISIALPDSTFGGIYPRSGLATKQGLAPANKVGVIDEDYRGPVIVTSSIIIFSFSLLHKLSAPYKSRFVIS